MKKLLLSILFLSILSFTGFSQIFTQNFTSSTNVGDYISGSPNNGQFNAIGASNSNALFNINNNALRLTRISTLSATAQFTRNLITPGAQAFLAIKFDLSVTGSTTAATTAATFYVGNALPTANATLPTTANGHSRFGINLTTNPTEFSLRDITGTTNSSVFSGPQQIFFAVNNSNSSINYLAPDGTFQSVPNDSWDLWVGNARVFTAVAAWGAAVDLNAFRFMFNGGMANIDITNITVDNLTTLPVDLTSFTGRANGQNIDLNWKTSSEENNSHFDIMRSIAGKPFVKIGAVNGAGTTQTPQDYSYTDTQPFPGTNYYQLKQVDNNGTEKLSKEILAIKSNVTASNFKIVSHRDKNSVDLSVFAAVDGNSTFKIYDLSGRKLIDKTLTLTKGYNSFSLPLQLTSQGVHIATLVTASETITNKFIQ